MLPNAYFTLFEASFVVHSPKRHWIATGSVAFSSRFPNAPSENISDTVANIRWCSSLVYPGTEISRFVLMDGGMKLPKRRTV